MAHNMRVKGTLWDRAEVLVPWFKTLPLVRELVSGEHATQAVLRVAIDRGLTSLEQERGGVAPVTPAAVEVATVVDPMIELERLANLIPVLARIEILRAPEGTRRTVRAMFDGRTVNAQQLVDEPEDSNVMTGILRRPCVEAFWSDVVRLFTEGQVEISLDGIPVKLPRAQEEEKTPALAPRDIGSGASDPVADSELP